MCHHTWPHVPSHVASCAITRGLMCHHTWPHVPSHVASCAITRGLMWPHTWPHVASHVASCAITRGLMCHHTWPHVASHVASCAVTRGLMCHHTWPHVPSHGASCAITRGLMCHHTWPHVPSHVASCAITRGLMCHHTWPHVPSHVASCGLTRGLMCRHTWPHVPSHVASCAITRGLMCHHTWPHVPSNRIITRSIRIPRVMKTKVINFSGNYFCVPKGNYGLNLTRRKHFSSRTRTNSCLLVLKEIYTVHEQIVRNIKPHCYCDKYFSVFKITLPCIIPLKCLLHVVSRVPLVYKRGSMPCWFSTLPHHKYAEIGALLLLRWRIIFYYFNVCSTKWCCKITYISQHRTFNSDLFYYSKVPHSELGSTSYN